MATLLALVFLLLSSALEWSGSATAAVGLLAVFAFVLLAAPLTHERRRPPRRRMSGVSTQGVEIIEVNVVAAPGEHVLIGTQSRQGNGAPGSGASPIQH